MRVLLAEDDFINQKALKLLLEKLGLEVTVVDNGLDAVELLSGDIQFDCVMMDYQMPKMDGMDATRKIREIFGKNKNIPIIGITANVMKCSRETAICCGMNDYLSKPVKLDDIVEAFNRCFDMAISSPVNWKG